MERKVALVAGASGVSGEVSSITSRASADWDVIGLARSPSDAVGRARFLSVDLLDPVTARQARRAAQRHPRLLCGVPGAAHRKRAGRGQHRDATQPGRGGRGGRAGTPAHVNLMEGPKPTAANLGLTRRPRRKSDPRHLPPNFYYDQEDFLRERQRGKEWTWSALRPTLSRAGCRPSDELEHGGRRLCLDLQGAGASALVPRHRAASRPFRGHRNSPPRQSGGLGCHRTALRERGLQHHQRRPLSLGAPLAGIRRVLRTGAGAPDAASALRDDGRQGAVVE